MESNKQPMRYIFLLLSLFYFASYAQIPVVSIVTGGTTVVPEPPSVFDDVNAWLRADNITGSSGSYVLEDLSPNNNDFTQAAGTVTIGTAANGQAKITGNSTARFNSSLSINRWPGTVVVIGLRAAGATMGFFGHEGASPFNSYWFGYETVNRLFVYHTAGTNNTTAEAGSTACYVNNNGYGHRVSMLNGVILDDMPLATMVNASADASIGTEYRGLNGDFQELLYWDRSLSMIELDEVYAYLNARYSMSIPTWTSLSPVATIWLGGQSNAGGRGDRGTLDVNVPAEYDGAMPGVNIWAGTTTWGTEFQTIDITTNNHNYYEPASAAVAFGPELTLGKEYIDRVGGSVYIVKVALGSTWMTYQATANGYWSPTANVDNQNSGLRRFSVAGRSWWQAMRVFQQAGLRPDLKAIIFHQGEQDATVEAVADQWAASADVFFDELDAELGTGQTPPRLICRIHSGNPEPYTNNVRTQQDNFVSSCDRCVLIDTDALGTRPGDSVHLSYQGQLDLGDDLQLEIP